MVGNSVSCYFESQEIFKAGISSLSARNMLRISLLRLLYFFQKFYVSSGLNLEAASIRGVIAISLLMQVANSIGTRFHLKCLQLK